MNKPGLGPDDHPWLQRFLEYLNAIRPVSLELKKKIIESVRIRSYCSGQLLLRPGDVPMDVCFIAAGTMRVFRVEKAKKSEKEVEVPTWFFKEGDLVVTTLSYAVSEMSTEYIQATSDAIVVSIEKKQIASLLRLFPELHVHGLLLLEKYYRLAEKQIAILKRTTAIDRYKLLMEHFPHLIMNVKDEYLASFIGIEPTYFSKVKAAYAQK